MNGGMSAIGSKQTSATALHMSAFGGEADITWASRRSLGVNRDGKLFDGS